MRIMMILVLGLAILGCSKTDFYNQVFSGTLEITEHKLGAKVAGRVSALMVEEGDHVKAGSVIATLDRYEQASKDYERAKKSYEQGGLTQQALEYAKLNLEDQQIIAPADGVILIKVHEEGEVVSSGTAVVVLGDVSDKWVKVYVPEGMVSRVKVGQKAVLSFDGVNNPYQGHVRSIGTKAEFTPRNVQTVEERVTQAFAVKVSLDDQAPDAHPGVFVDVRFKE